jgi:nitrogen fixation NifU-like protein
MNANDRIIEHYKHPHHKGTLLAPTVRQRDVNPFCGDEITIELLIENGHVAEGMFDGRGCSLSQAAASILLEESVGKPVIMLEALDEEAFFQLLAIEVGPVRRKCALLPLNVLHACLAEAALINKKEDQ